MADYKYAGPTVEDGVFKYEGSLSIPNSQGNRHWKEYEKYIDEGGLTDPWKTPEELQEMADLEDRVAAIEAEIESSAVHKYTPQQVKAYIDNAQNLDDVKTILKKIAVYLLK